VEAPAITLFNHDVGIFSIIMDNIDPKTVELQRKVVTKFNKSNWGVHTIKTNSSHGKTMDWVFNAIADSKSPLANVKVVVFLDIDAIPLSNSALDLLVEEARMGALIGNVQRSGHIENDQHLFVAPSVCAMSVDTYNLIGRPSAEPTARGDVAEEYTYAAEAAGIDVIFNSPLKYEHPVRRMQWETDRSPTWKLSDKKLLSGLQEYGVGTTFGYTGLEEVPLFYHNFQIFHPGHQQLFWDKCDKVLQG